MTFKEWNAVIMIAVSVVVAVWVAFEAITNPAIGVAAVAARLVWAIVFNIVLNIVAIIVMSIVVSVARREEFKDERADERDVAVGAKAMRNGYFLASIAGLICLILLATGTDPGLAIYALFGGLMLAGVADAASRLLYYRVG